MNYSEITQYIKELAALSDSGNHIVPFVNSSKGIVHNSTIGDNAILIKINSIYRHGLLGVGLQIIQLKTVISVIVGVSTYHILR